MFLVATALFAVKGLVRVSPEHMLPSMTCAVVLLTIAAHALRRAAWSVRLPIQAACVVAAALFVTFAMQTLRDIGENASSSARFGFCGMPATPGSSCVALDADMLNVARFIDENSALPEKIYVGPDRHDRIYVSDVALYFIARRLPGTKWHDSHPGVQTTSVVQSAMVADLEANRVKLVVEESTYDGVDEPNDSRLSSGVTIFDDYVARTFKPVFRAGNFTVLERRPS